ncbi:MAG: HAMP domain-containing sensor histidine kinase [Rhizobiaceae bacterium]
MDERTGARKDGGYTQADNGLLAQSAIASAPSALSAAEAPSSGRLAGEPDAIVGWRGLSGKLLLLTVIFVMVAEVLIFVPSVANYRNVWLQAYLDSAESASIVYLDSADPMLSQRAQRELLRSTASQAVVIQEGSMRRLMAESSMPEAVSEHIDMTTMHPVKAITSALAMLLSPSGKSYRVFAPMKSRDAIIELVQTDVRLKHALRLYARNVLLLSLAISLITASLVFLALHWLIVRPIRRLSRNMNAFSAEPDNASLIYEPTGRRDEIGVAETRLAAFETDLHNTLRQRQHLADLGLAVSKINHDLRNILASAQLFSDRLSSLPDPTVQRLAPKLLRTIDRAASYTGSVLAYGKAAEQPPRRQRHRLARIVDDVGELLGLPTGGSVEWRNQVPGDLEADVDAEQFFRVMLNLCRNAVQAMEKRGADHHGSAVSRITVSGRREANGVELRVADTGEGMASDMLPNLFRAFQGSARPGGTGLGLAIAAELVRAHGGMITLVSTSPAGTEFLIRLPDQPSRSTSA